MMHTLRAAMAAVLLCAVIFSTAAADPLQPQIRFRTGLPMQEVAGGHVNDFGAASGFGIGRVEFSGGCWDVDVVGGEVKYVVVTGLDWAERGQHASVSRIRPDGFRACTWDFEDGELWKVKTGFTFVAYGTRPEE